MTALDFIDLPGVRLMVVDRLDEAALQAAGLGAAAGLAHVSTTRELEIPLIIGEQSREGTLRMAGVQRCRALMAVASADVSNLEAALHGRNLQERLHVVLRLFDGDLASRVRRTFNLPLSRSVSGLRRARVWPRLAALARYSRRRS